MPYIDPVTGVRYAIGGDAPSIPFHTKNMVDDMRNVLPSRFATAALRDQTIVGNLFTPAGIPEGLHSYVVGSGFWEYDGAGWKPMGPSIATVKVYTGSPSVTSTSAGPANVPNIHNTTFTSRRKRLYRCNFTGVLQGDTVGSQFRLYATDEAGVRLDIRDNIDVGGGQGGKYFSYTSVEYPLNAGTHTIGCTFTLIVGGGTLYLNGLTLTVTDLGPA